MFQDTVSVVLYPPLIPQMLTECLRGERMLYMEDLLMNRRALTLWNLYPSGQDCFCRFVHTFIIDLYHLNEYKCAFVPRSLRV